MVIVVQNLIDKIDACDASFTGRHILLDCVDCTNTRKLYYKSRDSFKLFQIVPKDKTLGFIREIGLYHKIENSFIPTAKSLDKRK